MDPLVINAIKKAKKIAKKKKKRISSKYLFPIVPILFWASKRIISLF